MSLAALCRSRGTLQRKTVTKDQSGGQTAEWEDVVTNEACSIQPATGDVKDFYAQMHLNCTNSIYFTRDIDAKKQDRFTATVRSRSRTFKVVGYRIPADDYASWPGVLDVEEELQ